MVMFDKQHTLEEGRSTKAVPMKQVSQTLHENVFSPCSLLESSLFQVRRINLEGDSDPGLN